MIVELSVSFRRGQLDPYFDAIHNLLYAHINGHHILLSSRDVLDRLLELEVWSRREHAALQRIRQGYPQFAGLARDAEFTVLALPDGAPKIREENNQKFILPLTAFGDATACQPFFLLVENEASDGRFYSVLLDCMARELGLGKSPNLNPWGGGGSTISRAYVTAATRGQPFFCIVDSDKKTPNSSYGSTAASFLAAVESCEALSISGYHILCVREMENLVPVSIYRELFIDDVNMSVRIDMLDRLRTFEAGGSRRCQWRFLGHVDLKNGIRRSDLRSEPREVQEYLLQASSVVLNGRTNNGLSLEDLPEVVVFGLGEGWVEKFVERAQSGRFRDQVLSAIKSDPSWPEMRSLGRTLASFAAAGQPLRL